MIRAGGRRASVAGQLWRLAILTATGTLGTTAAAQASQRYWSEFNPGYAQSERNISHRGHHSRQAKPVTEKQAAKPQGPLIIAISLQNQKLRLYDGNGLFAETAISTGMRGHPTPMGVFSVIQKQKLHHSNIYSGAPMPYMQRITWSGIAIHAGVLPGYPASHGCIRMPMAFAIKMWNWTKMGARVVITPGEISPVSFAHALLAAQKVAPSIAGAERLAPPPVAADKAANLELRTTVGHSDNVRVADATPAGAGRSPRELAFIRADSAASVSADAVSLMTADAANAVEKPDSAKAEVARPAAGPVTAQTGAVASSVGKPLASSASEIVRPETGSATIAPSEKSAAKADTPATASLKVEPKAGGPEAGSVDAGIEASKPDAAKATVQPDAINADGSNRAPDRKESVRPPDNDKPAVAQPDPAKTVAPKRSGQIAVFISRKDFKALCAAEFRKAVRRAGDDCCRRPSAGNACLHRAD